MALLCCSFQAAAIKPMQPVAPAALKVPVVKPALVAAPSVAAPRGSYLDSCPVVRAEGDTLYATCTSGIDGNDYESTISISRCAGVDVVNSIGYLRCATPVRAHWAGNVLPPGSYLSSCVWASVDGEVLTATCNTGNRTGGVLGFASQEETLNSTLSLAGCPDGADIGNHRGRLACIK